MTHIGQEKTFALHGILCIEPRLLHADFGFGYFFVLFYYVYHQINHDTQNDDSDNNATQENSVELSFILHFHPVLLIRSPKIVDAVGITGSYYGIGDHTDFFIQACRFLFMVHLYQ